MDVYFRLEIWLFCEGRGAAGARKGATTHSRPQAPGGCAADGKFPLNALARRATPFNAFSPKNIQRVTWPPFQGAIVVGRRLRPGFTSPGFAPKGAHPGLPYVPPLPRRLCPSRAFHHSGIQHIHRALRETYLLLLLPTPTSLLEDLENLGDLLIPHTSFYQSYIPLEGRLLLVGKVLILRGPRSGQRPKGRNHA